MANDQSESDEDLTENENSLGKSEINDLNVDLPPVKTFTLDDMRKLLVDRTQKRKNQDQEENVPSNESKKRKKTELDQAGKKYPQAQFCVYANIESGSKMQQAVCELKFEENYSLVCKGIILILRQQIRWVLRQQMRWVGSENCHFC